MPIAVVGLRLRVLLSALALIVLVLLVQPAGAVSPNLVVSQVYGGGGNTGATFTNDFIEIFNRGTSSVDLDAYSLQYASATGQGTSARTAPSRPSCRRSRPRAGPVRARARGLGRRERRSASTRGRDRHGSDQHGGRRGEGRARHRRPGSAATGARLVRRDRARADRRSRRLRERELRGPGGCADPDRNDRGGAEPGGHVDTDNNLADHSGGADAAQHRHDARAVRGDAAPSVTSTTPANGATGVALDLDITVGFSENVNVTGSWFTPISCASSGAHRNRRRRPAELHAEPGRGLRQGESCTVTVAAALVTDQDASDPPDTMAADHVFSFTTLAPPSTIVEIQGAAHISPKNGQSVNGVEGVVTARRTAGGRGVWIQDLTPDGDPATSDAVFVFTNACWPRWSETS